MSVEQYALACFGDRSPKTLDLLMLPEQPQTRTERIPPSLIPFTEIPHYTPHLSLSEIQLELGKRRLLQGILRANPLNKYEAFIVSRNFPVSVIVHGTGLK